MYIRMLVIQYPRSEGRLDESFRNVESRVLINFLQTNSSCLV